jgi:hypothetical protein
LKPFLRAWCPEDHQGLAVPYCQGGYLITMPCGGFLVSEDVTCPKGGGVVLGGTSKKKYDKKNKAKRNTIKRIKQKEIR